MLQHSCCEACIGSADIIPLHASAILPEAISDGSHLSSDVWISERQHITFVLYYGKEPWDGAKDLHQLLNFQDIPDDLKKLVSNYKINLVEIRKIEDTSVFQTDVKQVFDFIRCSEDSEKLKELVEHDPAYQSMEEDAFDLAVHYTASKELVQVKDYYTKGGSVDMCRALTELIEQGRAEGKAEALRALVETCREFGVTYEDALERIMDKLSMSEEEAEACLDQYWK